ncbi:MAG: sulfotransferase family 2 domain-containing protein [Cyclobacteriaceae bacterium]
MLVSHDYKFILVKTKKTAGSSIQAYLEPYCENGHITRNHPESHMPAEEIRKLIGEEAWNSYLKITPIRNPWDKMVSLYYWRTRKRSAIAKIRRFLWLKWSDDPARKMTFTEHVKYLNKINEVNIDKDVIYVDGKVPEYEYIRFEHLLDDMKAVCEKIGVPFEPERLPNKKGGVRKAQGYQNHYDEESKAIVAQAYTFEIEKFGYTF